MSISRTSRPDRLLPRWRSAARCLPLGALLLGGCSDFVENVPPRPAASDDPAVADTPYPDLAAVPARPQLGYTLEQRREIAQGLVADRANARHAGDTLRADLGRPVEPDTAPPLPPLPEAEPEPAPDPEADLALAYVEEALARDSDDGSLGDFLDRLERRTPTTTEPQPPASPPAAEAAEPRAAGQEPTAAAEPATPTEIVPVPPADEPLPEQSEADQPLPEDSEADQRSVAPEASSADSAVAEPGVAEPALAEPAVAEPGVAEPGVEPSAEVNELADTAGPQTPELPPAVATDGPGEPATEVVAATNAPTVSAPAGPAVAAVANQPASNEPVPNEPVPNEPVPTGVEPVPLPIAVLFDPDQVEVADDWRRRLAQAARELRGNGVAVVVSGGGVRAGLAMERARRVAALLARAGVPATRITLEMGGERDAVVVYDADV